MSSSLTDEQSTAVRQWAEQGADLAAIQQRLDEEFEVRLTFMDTRFLIADLGIELVAEEEPEAEPEEEEQPSQEQEAMAPESDAEEAEGALDSPDGEPQGGGPEAPADAADDENATATVTISEVQRPGVMVSGTVTFDGGEKAEWHLDQMGQLGMNPDTPEFRPTPSQMRAFQSELQKAAQQKGI